MTEKFYAGIGSRDIPVNIANLMTDMATILDSVGYTLRSGGANGSDLAFEAGATNKEIWVPWSGFNNSTSTLTPTQFHYDIGSQFHPSWNTLRDSVKKLHARNVGQILGHDGSNPSKFVLCWTPDACTNGLHTTKHTGGTGQALRIAAGYNVPIININTISWEDELSDLLFRLNTV